MDSPHLIKLRVMTLGHDMLEAAVHTCGQTRQTTHKHGTKVAWFIWSQWPPSRYSNAGNSVANSGDSLPQQGPQLSISRLSFSAHGNGLYIDMFVQYNIQYCSRCVRQVTCNTHMHIYNIYITYINIKKIIYILSQSFTVYMSIYII